MKGFLQKTLRFLFPIVIIPLVAYIAIDPFKILREYDCFYSRETTARVVLNKDHVSAVTFNKKPNKATYNSFIFGNSRSIFYQTSDWKPLLDSTDRCFHFDASSETLVALHKKVIYLHDKGVKMDNVLMVIDRSVLDPNNPWKGHLTETSPILDRANLLRFHKALFEAYLNPQFIIGLANLYIYDNFEVNLNLGTGVEYHPLQYDCETNEMRLEYFEELMAEENYYTKDRVKQFFQRPIKELVSSAVIGQDQKTMLKEMAIIFNENSTDLHIIISPLYGQTAMNPTDIVCLGELFGQESIHNFSGKNELTEDFHNYYEISHYRPHVAKFIMDSVYSE